MEVPGEAVQTYRLARVMTGHLWNKSLRQSAWIVVSLYKLSGFGCNILRVTGLNFLCNCSDWIIFKLILLISRICNSDIDYFYLILVWDFHLHCWIYWKIVIFRCCFDQISTFSWVFHSIHKWLLRKLFYSACWVILHIFCFLLTFLHFFKIKFQENHQCQTVGIQIQTVCFKVINYSCHH